MVFSDLGFDAIEFSAAYSLNFFQLIQAEGIGEVGLRSLSCPARICLRRSVRSLMDWFVPAVS